MEKLIPLQMAPSDQIVARRHFPMNDIHLHDFPAIDTYSKCPSLSRARIFLRILLCSTSEGGRDCGNERPPQRCLWGLCFDLDGRVLYGQLSFLCRPWAYVVLGISFFLRPGSFFEDTGVLIPESLPFSAAVTHLPSLSRLHFSRRPQNLIQGRA